MATVTYSECDWCGKQIDITKDNRQVGKLIKVPKGKKYAFYRLPGLHSELRNDRKQEYDLCPDCANELERFILDKQKQKLWGGERGKGE